MVFVSCCVSPPALSKYRQKAKDLMAAARLEKEKEKEGAAATATSPDKETAANTAESSGGGAPPVIIRQRSMTPRSQRENNHRLSYIDNEIRFLDAEQQEIDRQAAILDKRLR
jgi:hypothetical protein